VTPLIEEDSVALTVSWCPTTRTWVLAGILLAAILAAVKVSCRGLSPAPGPVVHRNTTRYYQPDGHGPAWTEPPITDHRPPSVTLGKPRKAPTTLDLPIPASEVRRVIEVAPAGSDGPLAGPPAPTTTIIERTDGTLLVPEPQLDRVRVVEVLPRTLAWRPRASLGVHLSPANHRIDPELGLSLLSIRDRLQLPYLAVTQHAAGAGAALRLHSHLHATLQWTREWSSGSYTLAGSLVVMLP
jgi:hypothetical protein